MELHVKKANILEQMVLQNIAQDAFLQLSGGMMKEKRDTFLAIYNGLNPVGCAVLLARNCPSDGLEIQCIHIFKEYRGRHYAKECITVIKDYTKQAGYTCLYVRLVESHQYAEVLKAVLRYSGFSPYDKAEIMSCRVSGENQVIWQETLSKYYDKLGAWLERQGIKTVSFAEANEELIHKLLHDKGLEFDSRYNIESIYQNTQGIFLKDASFIAYRNDTPVAITMLLEADEKALVFQLISEAKTYQKMGTIILPIVKSMDWSFRSKYEKVSFCIFDYNTPMKKVSDNIFSKMIYKQTIQYCYRCQLEEEDR